VVQVQLQLGGNNVHGPGNGGNGQMIAHSGDKKTKVGF
jgi:hypothetical protein